MSKALNNSERRPWPRTLALAVAVATATVLGGAGSVSQAATNVPDVSLSANVKIETAVQTALARGESPAVLVRFKGKADLSAAFAITDRDARATYVYETLKNFAAREQSQALQTLAAQFSLSESAHEFTVLWIDNSIAISRMSAPMLASLSSDPNIASIRTQRTIQLPLEPEVDTAPWVPHVVESSLAHIKVPDVWALGYTGSGVVVANIDAGVRHSHAALVNQYRGNLGGGSFDHNFNWYDPYNHSATPRWTHDHGTHTMGTMVGDDGGTNQIGAAPGAKWTACIGFGQPNAGGTDAGLLECGQWALAPYPTAGGGTADPTKHADIVNNSWGDCGQSYDNWYEGVIDGWIAAGMVPVFSNGNSSNCGYPSNPPLNTVGNPARSGKVLGIGSTGTSNGAYASHSNKGPTDNSNPGLPNYPDPAGFADLKPNVSAPGVNIRSAYVASDTAYGGMTGTSMSAPAATGVLALMWDAAPCLKGNYGVTGSLLMSSAVAIPVATGSPSDGPGNVPNQATGWGEIDALAAVNAGIAFCSGGGLLPPSLSKAFAPATIEHGTNSVLTLTLANPNATVATLDAALTDNLPTGVVIAATPAAATTCGGGAASAIAGGSSVSLASGATIPASGSCTVTVSVTAPANGSFVNTIPAGGLSTDAGANANPAEATLVVNDTGEVFPAPYCAFTVDQDVEPITRVLFAGIDNPSSATVNGTPALEDFTAVIGNVTAGGSLPMSVEGNTAGDFSTTITTFVDWNQDGDFADAGETHPIGIIENSTGADGQQATANIAVPAGALAGNTRMRVTKKFNAAATACNTAGYGQAEDYTLTVAPAGPSAPTVAKAFLPTGIAVGATSTLTITLGNANAGVVTLSADLVDSFPAGLVVAATPNVASTCGGVVTAVAGSATVSLGNGGTIPAGSCTINVDVTSAADGSYVNTIAVGALQTDFGNNADAATATLNVGSAAAPVIQVTPNPLAFTVDFGATDSDPLTIGNTGGSPLTFSINEAAAARQPASFRTARLAKSLSLSQGSLQHSALPAGYVGHYVAPNGGDVLAQMTNNAPASLAGISCGAQDGSSTSANSYWRRFYLNEHGAPASISIESVTVGTEAGPNIDATINLYSIPHGTPIDTIPTAALTLIGSGTGTVGGDLTTSTIPVVATLADAVGTDLVVEYHIEGSPTGPWYPGGNASAETHTSFISAAECGIAEPTAMADINYPDSHNIIVVNLGAGGPPACDNPSDIPWLSVSPASGSVAGGASTDATVSVNGAGLAAGDYSANVCVSSNDPVTPIVTVPVSLTVNPEPVVDTIFCDGFDGTACGGGTPGDVVTGTINQPAAATGDGSSFDFALGDFHGYNGAITADDINLYTLGAPAINVYWYGDSVPTEFAELVGGVVGTPGGMDFVVLQSGDVVGAASPLSAASNGADMSAFEAGVNGYIGVAFYNEGTGAVNYGYLHVTTSAGGFPIQVLDYGYDSSGADITIP